MSDQEKRNPLSTDPVKPELEKKPVIQPTQPMQQKPPVPIVQPTTVKPELEKPDLDKKKSA